MDIGKTSNVNIPQYKFNTKKSTKYTEGRTKVSKSENNSNENLYIISDEDRLNEFDELLKRLRESADSNNNPMSAFIKCLEIARRIMNGHRVPVQDIKFLAESEPEMYSNAILLRKQNDYPKKYDSLLEDKEDTAVEITADEIISSDIIETSIDIEA